MKKSEPTIESHISVITKIMDIIERESPVDLITRMVCLTSIIHACVRKEGEKMKNTYIDSRYRPYDI